MTKPCISCKKEKPLSEYYAHPEMRDGHLNKCKVCCRAYANGHNKKAHVLERDRIRNARPERVAARKAYAKTPEGKAALARAKAAWRDRNKRKRAAHVAVGNAVRDGKLVPQPCEECGMTAQAHHDDYSKPLDVRWLCPTHHSQWHKHNEPF